ncbi:chymotrypsin-1-like [Phlebotomus argentipes]|uniref:chymotrypsin-1-like n=1 Tax=Phlebotomus argentipes TaxID=94469 RepID=UPI00289327ED|nr:chymotrypsin-1-like [Phlebotomus argentipes]
MAIKLVVFGALLATALGLHVPDASPRIVGGSDAFPGQFPHTVSLRTLNYAHFCAGSLVSISWVLTSAHCTLGRADDGVIVVAGSVQLSQFQEERQSQRVVSHPNFNANTMAYDIALVHTAQPFPITPSIRPIAMANGTLPAGITGVLSAWGHTSYPGGELNDNLQWLFVSTIGQDDCRSRVPAADQSFVHDNTVCTVRENPGHGLCLGNLGGSLLVGNSIAAVASWHIGCAVGYPDNHARVASHIPWIHSVMIGG